MTDITYDTAGGLRVTRSQTPADYDTAIETLIDQLDGHRGALFSSNYEYPGRYVRWDTGLVDPPVAITARGRSMVIEALNARGEVLLGMIAPALEGLAELASFSRAARVLTLQVAEPGAVADEDARSRVPSVFSVLRAIIALFRSDEDGEIGLYGAFGYDLAFQFDPVEQVLARPETQRDLVLYLADRLWVVDHYAVRAWVVSYEFAQGDASTEGLPRDGAETPFQPAARNLPRGDHEPGEYARLVDVAKESFRRGDLFEVVPGQTFYEAVPDAPSAIFRRLKATNPSPYGFFLNLGAGEYLVGASPEMFVRVTGRRVETCPISGTIKRGADAIEDSEQILKLLMSKKDESELTMCSDVDRNDKSRVCEPGSVRVIGRRQIEMYSRLIHTVDHIEGRLREGLDALDAFLSHAWAVTVTGAPKLWAMRFIERHEKSPRAWYGGAVGMLHFNGEINTGLTLRTVRIVGGVAEVRAGATLLFDSDAEEEERETELKASAMRAAVTGGIAAVGQDDTRAAPGAGRRILLVDHEDSFVHTLANYFRQTGAELKIVRTPVNEDLFDTYKPDLVVLSPGPGMPGDFDCATTLRIAVARGVAIFGVCLGLQAIAEAHGAELGTLDPPMHGKPSRVRVAKSGRIFAGLPEVITVGRYHSLHALEGSLRQNFLVTALSEDGVVMAIEHRTAPIAAVQFHPESIMTLGGSAGYRMIENVVAGLQV